MVFRPQLAALLCGLSLLVSSCQSATTTTVTVPALTSTVRDTNIGSVVWNADAVPSNSGANVASLSWSHTVASGQNRLLVVAITKRSTTEVTSVTWGTTPLTRLVKSVGTGNTARAELWYLVNPAVGTDTVTATNAVADHWNAFSLDFSGVNPTTPFDTPNSAVGTTANPTLAVDSTANDLVLDVLCYERGGLSNDNNSVGMGQILKTQKSLSGDNWSGALSTEAGSSTVTMSWNRTSAGINWAQVAVGIKPAP